ncbi:hypothetical protein DMC30DRAFT_418959 [Rhodotorula diobovata]|uniref:CFEM domain-containing protein n=1 Tax=Rhodotorula diobovata TaxID=5288 RepID=A0A5C5FND5_9BASI|nr:hypothetical protein DMC30DRAFT_418959 [Rhodotorula diobovata]
MRTSVFALAALGSAASLVAAQATPPACFLTCFAQNLGSSSCSGATDLPCLCADQAFQSATTSCIQSSCTGDDLQAAAQYATTACAAVGVTITTPDASSTEGGASSTESSMSMTSSMPMSSGASSAASSVSSAISSAVASGSSAASSSAASVQSSVSSAVSSLSQIASSATGGVAPSASAGGSSDASSVKVGGALAGVAALAAALAF